MTDHGLIFLATQMTCCILTVAAVLYVRTKELDRREAALHCLRGDGESYLASAEFVLRDPDTPEEIRRMVLFVLATMRSEELSRDFAQFLAKGDRATDASSDEPIDLEIQKLQAKRPDLAAHAQEAAFGLMFCAPILYSDKLRVEIVRTGATRPGHIWSLLAAGIMKLWPKPRATSEPNMGSLSVASHG